MALIAACEPVIVTVALPLPLIAPLVTPPTALVRTVSVPLLTPSVTEMAEVSESTSAIDKPVTGGGCLRRRFARQALCSLGHRSPH